MFVFSTTFAVEKTNMGAIVMVPLIITEPAQVANALEADLGLTKDVLLDVVWRMVRVRRDCTRDYPAGAQPILAYHAGTERVRSVTTPFGYLRDDVDQIESAFNPRLGVKIVVANTDEGTGLEDHSPRNVSGKGPATRRTVDSAQQSFISVLDASLPSIKVYLKGQEQDETPVSFWYLCVFETSDTVRAEISRPKALTGDFFSGFHRRIVLVGPDEAEASIEKRDPDIDRGDAPEFDIPVVRR